MKPIIVLSTYSHKILKPFGESMRYILTGSLNDLNIKNSYVYFDAYQDYNFNDSIVIFLMPPERYLEAKKSVAKNNNIFVLWNLEPFYICPPKNIKYIERRELMFKIIGDSELNYVWLYHKDQVAVLNNNKCWFVPIGYHKCLEPKTKIDKCTQRAFVFLGFMTGERKRYFDLLERNFKKIGRRGFRIKKVIHSNYIDFFSNVNKMSMFRLAIDVCANDFNKMHIRWHRLVSLAGAGLAILSDVRLENYGFKDGEHYFYIEGVKKNAEIMDKVWVDFNLIDKVANNMCNKLNKDYNMVEILKYALSKIYEQN